MSPVIRDRDLDRRCAEVKIERKAESVNSGNCIACDSNRSPAINSISNQDVHQLDSYGASSC